MDTPYTVEWVAAQLGETPRWVKAKVTELGVPHLRLARRRMAFTADHYDALLKALEATATTSTQRSRARQRKGRAA